MSKTHLITILVAWVILAVGCSDDDDGSSGSAVNLLVPGGGKPIASPDGNRILFSREGPDGGLFVLEEGIARRLFTDGPAARADYCWSRDGTRVAFSSPGQPGDAGAGIYVSTDAALTQLERVWDRGASPLFSFDGDEIICAGPEDGESDGIWKINLGSGAIERIVERGVLPRLSPDGHQLAYLYTTGLSLGRSLVIFDRRSLERDTVGVNAMDMAWLHDSHTVIYESSYDTVYNPFAQGLYRVTPESDPPGERIVESGIYPRVIPGTEEYVYSAVNGAEIGGIFIGDKFGNVEQISDSGVTAWPISRNRIIAAAPSGIFEILR